MQLLFLADRSCPFWKETKDRKATRRARLSAFVSRLNDAHISSCLIYIFILEDRLEFKGYDTKVLNIRAEDREFYNRSLKSMHNELSEGLYRILFVLIEAGVQVLRRCDEETTVRRDGDDDEFIC